MWSFGFDTFPTKKKKKIVTVGLVNLKRLSLTEYNLFVLINGFYLFYFQYEWFNIWLVFENIKMSSIE